MTRSNIPSIARNAAANWLAFIYVAAVSFFLSPFVVRHLGDTAYGLWSLLGALVGYLGLLDFGVRGAVTRYVAHHHAASDTTGSSRIVSAALLLFGLLGIAAIALSGVVAYLLPSFFNIPESLVDDARAALLLGGLTVAATLVGAVFGGVVTGLQRFDIISGVEILVTTVRTVAVVLALREGYGIVSLGVIHLAGSMLSGAAAWITARRKYPELRFQLRQPLLPHVRTILSFSVYLSLIHIFGVLIYYSDAVVIAVFLPVGVVTVFAIAANLCEYAAKVAGGLSRLMTPRVSALAAAGSDRIGEEILGAARIATLATGSIAVTFWFRGEAFVNLWMGPEYGPPCAELLRIFGFVVWLGGARAVASSSIIGVNRHRTLIPAFGVEAVSNLALSALLVKPLGLTGVAFGTLVPSLLVSLGFVPRCLAAATGVSARAFYHRAWLLPSLACVPFGVATLLVERFFPATSLAQFFAQVIALLPLIGVAGLILCLTPPEKRAVVSVLRKMIAVIAARTHPWIFRFDGAVQRLRRTASGMRAWIGDAARVATMVLVLTPAARYLPRPWSLAVADLVGLLVALTPVWGREIRAKMRRTFGTDYLESVLIAAKWISRPLRDIVMAHRTLRGKEDLLRRRIEERNSVRVQALRDSGESFIIVTGHFAREAMQFLYSAQVTPQQPVTIVAPIEPLWLHPHAIRVRLQFKLMLDALQYIRPDLDSITADSLSSYALLVKRLKKPGTVLITAADAAWHRGRTNSHARGFAGLTSRTFAVGMARLSRVTQCPIAVCIPYIAPDDSVVLEWGPVIPPPAVSDDAADARITDVLLDRIEQAVGLRPAQYILDVFGGRRWNAAAGRWELSRDSSAVQVVPASE